MTLDGHLFNILNVDQRTSMDKDWNKKSNLRNPFICIVSTCPTGGGFHMFLGWLLFHPSAFDS